MQQDSTVKIIIEKYYNNIFRFCRYTLKDDKAAEECTQKTFAILIKKQRSLNFSTNLQSWLSDTAVRVMKKYSRKNKLKISIAESPFADEAEEFFEQKKLEQIAESLISSCPKSKVTNRMKWLSVAVACIILVTGLNHYTMTNCGVPWYSFVNQMRKTGFRVNFEDEIIELPTSDDDPYGIKAKCAEYGFCPLTPAYIPEDYKLVDIVVEKLPECTNLRFSYRKFYDNYMQKDKFFNLDYLVYKEDKVIPSYNIPSDKYNVEEKEINGIKVVTLYEDNRFSALFQKDSIVHSIHSQNLDYDECQKILESIS